MFINEIDRAIRPAIEAERLELCEVKIGGSSRSPVIMVTIDRREAFVDIETCVMVTRLVQDILGITRAAPASCRIEVSSPGVDRPLNEVWHFKKTVGQKIRYSDAAGVIEGIVQSVSDDGRIELLTKEGQRNFSYDELSGAKVVIEMFSKTGKPGRKRNEARHR